MYQTEVQVRVRYGETDQMGYVYYGNYASYYEVARVESFRTLGLSYKELEDDVQARVQNVWDSVTTETIDELTDYKGYHQEFLHLFGFDYDNVDYDAEVNPEVTINNLV